MTEAATLRAAPAARALAVLGALLLVAGVSFKLSGVDRAWMLAVHAQPASSFGVVAWSCLTVLGLGWSALIVVLAADRGNGRLTTLLVATFLISTVLTHGPKRLIHSPRPAATALEPQLHVIGQVLKGSVSMPSGHALSAAATLALLFVVLPRGRRLVAGVPIALVCALIAVSRVVVGAHWPSDVAVGAGLGFVSVALALLSLDWRRTRALHQRLRLRTATATGQAWTGVAEVAFAIGLLREHTGYPAGQPIVFALATLAVASALWRWVAVLRARRAAPASVPERPAEQP